MVSSAVHRARRVEGREVLRRPHRQLLDLSLRHRDAEDFLGLLDDGVERDLARLLGDHAPHAERVQVVGQVERGVRREQRVHALRLVRPALDLDHAHDREQPARPLPMRGASNAVRAAHVDQALARRPEIEVSLQRPPLDLAPVLPDVRLELRVVVGERRARAEVLLHLVQLLAGAEEDVPVALLRRAAGANACIQRWRRAPTRWPPPRPLLRRQNERNACEIRAADDRAPPPATSPLGLPAVALFGHPAEAHQRKSSGICPE